MLSCRLVQQIASVQRLVTLQQLKDESIGESSTPVLYRCSGGAEAFRAAAFVTLYTSYVHSVLQCCTALLQHC